MSGTCQTLRLGNGPDWSACDVDSDDVSVIIGSRDSSQFTTGSSMVQVHRVVSFTWDKKWYWGRQIAMDRTGHFLAYGIQRSGKASGSFRLLDLVSSKRELVNDLRGPVTDLDFCVTKQEVLLGVTDTFGQLYVYEIKGNPVVFEVKLRLRVEQGESAMASDFHILRWCPWIDDEDDEQDEEEEEVLAKRLILTHGSLLEVWDVHDILVSVADLSDPIVKAEDCKECVWTYRGHSDNVLCAALSPDSQYMASGSQDGSLVFCVFEDETRCVREHYRFQPHEGDPVFSVFFLDSLRGPPPDQGFWEYLVTGGMNNTELKLWHCANWTGLQTLRFIGDDQAQDLFLRAECDDTGKCIVLSDIRRKQLLIVSLSPSSPSARRRSFASIAEFPLRNAILSFAVSEAGLKKFDPSTGFSHLQDGLDSPGGRRFMALDGRGDEPVQTVMRVKLLAIQAMQLVEVGITYPRGSEGDGQPMATSSLPTASFETQGRYQDSLADISGGAQMNGSQEGDEEGDGDLSGPSPPSLEVQDIMDMGSTPAEIEEERRLLRKEEAQKNAATLKKEPDGRRPSGTMAASADSSIGSGSTFIQTHTTASIMDTLIRQMPGSLSVSQENAQLKTVPGSSSTHSAPLHFPPPMWNSMPSLTPTSLPAIGSEFADAMSQRLSQLVGVSHSNVGPPTPPERPMSPVAHTLEVGHEVRTTVHSVEPAPAYPVSPPPTNVATGSLIDFDSQDQDQSSWNVLNASNKGPGAKRSVFDERDNKLDHILGILTRQTESQEKITRSIKGLEEMMSNLQQEVEGLRTLKDISVASSSSDTTPAPSSSTVPTGSGLDVALRSAQRETLVQLCQKLLPQLVLQADKSFSRTVEQQLPKIVQDVVTPAMVQNLQALKDLQQEQMNRAMTDARDVMVKKMLEDSQISVLKKSVLTTFAEGAGKAVELAVKKVMIQEGLKSYEAALRTITEEFNRKLSKTAQNLSRHLESHFEDQLTKIDDMKEGFMATCEAVSREVKSLPRDVATLVSQHTSQIISQGNQELKAEVHSLTRASAVATPALGQEGSVLQAIRNKQYDAGFQIALYSNDVDLVLSACKQVSPETILSIKPQPLHQTTLIALVQQLSANMAADMDVRLNWIEFSLVHLDARHHRANREAILRVLAQLEPQITKIFDDPTLSKDVPSSTQMKARVIIVLAQKFAGEINELAH